MAAVGTTTRPTMREHPFVRLSVKAALSFSIVLVVGACMPASFAAKGAASSAAVTSRYDTTAIAAEFDRQCSAGLFSGVVEIRARDEVLFSKSCGDADVANRIPNTRETRFRIYSTSKFMTSLTAMRLVEQGRMSLDAPLSRYVPDIPAAWSAVTIRQLLQHTSGIKDLEPELITAFHRDFDSALRDMLASLPAQRGALDTPPGTKFAYNNFGFDLLAAAVQRATAQPFPEVVQQLVFDPAGMKSASFQPVNLVMGHPWDAAEEGLALGYNGEPAKLAQATNWSFIQLGAGAIRATVADFVALDAALRSGKVVSRASLREMERAPVTPPPDEPHPTKGRRYGLGMLVHDIDGVRMAGHTGGNNGFISDFERVDDSDVMMIALTNRGFAKTAWLREGVAAMVKAARRR